MIIDFHTHIFPGPVAAERDSYLDDPGFRLLYSQEKSKIIDHHILTDYIKNNRLDGAVAMSFPWIDEKNALFHNEYMASVSGKSGIYSFGVIPFRGSRKIISYVREIKDSGLYGIGEIAFYQGNMGEAEERFLRDVLEAAADLSLPVCLHLNEPVGHTYPGKYDPSLATVYEIIKNIPGARVILSHWGGGLFFYELMPEVSEVLKNVFYDTAATPFIYRDGVYRTALNIIGADKILFGSDYPLLSADRYLGSVKKECHSEEECEKILSGNARKILGI